MAGAVEVFADESAYVKMVSAIGFTGGRQLLLPLRNRDRYIAYVTGGGVGMAEDERIYWDSPEGQRLIKNADQSDMLLSLTDLFRKCSDDRTIACLSGKNGDGIRAFVERTNPQTQCARTISGVTGETLCWICGGGGFEDTAQGLELRPECEHVFPIAQAVCFSGLFETNMFNEIASRENLSAANAYVKGVKYEYQWAHRICNQVKRDMHFIVYNPDTNRPVGATEQQNDRTRKAGFSISDDKIRELLTKIVETQSYGTGRGLMNHLRNTSPATIERWKLNRIPAIRAVAERLLGVANTAQLTVEQHARVTVMSIRSYLATHSECAGMVESIPVNPARQGLPGQLHPATTTEFLRAYTSATVQDVTGIMNAALRGRGSQITGITRGKIAYSLSKVGREDPTAINDTYNSITVEDLNNLRRQVFYYLKGVPGANVSSREVWSKFQVLLGQMIAVHVCGVAARQVPLSVVADPDIVPLLRSDIVTTALRGWLQTKIDQVNRPYGIDIYNAIISTPNVDPRPAEAPPDWLLMGGMKRRMIFSTRTLLFTPERRQLYGDNTTGLRKRAKTRRLRKPTSKSRRRRTV